MNRLFVFGLLFVSIFCACSPAKKGSQQAPDHSSSNSEQLSFDSPSSNEIVKLATKCANELEISTNRLGSNIYGLEIPQVVKKDAAFEYKNADGHTFSYDNPKDAVKSRWGEIWMQYRRHWREQDGWLDHQHELTISPGDFSLDAVKKPRTPEEWRESDSEVHIRLLYADTPEEIEKGKDRLRSCGQTCFEFALQNKIEDDVTVFLYLDLYDPSEVGPNIRFSN